MNSFMLKLLKDVRFYSSHLISPPVVTGFAVYTHGKEDKASVEYCT